MARSPGREQSDEWKRCSRPAAEAKSKSSIAIISGIYNANSNGIQRANYVQNPMRRVRRCTDATIKYPASSIMVSLLHFCGGGGGGISPSSPTSALFRSCPMTT